MSFHRFVITHSHIYMFFNAHRTSRAFTQTHHCTRTLQHIHTAHVFAQHCALSSCNASTSKGFYTNKLLHQQVLHQQAFTQTFFSQALLFHKLCVYSTPGFLQANLCATCKRATGRGRADCRRLLKIYMNRSI